MEPHGKGEAVFEAFYNLRTEMNTVGKGGFSAREVALQAYRDTECFNLGDKQYLANFLDAYVSNSLSWRESETLSSLRKESAVFERLYCRKTMLERKRTFVRNELQSVAKAINEDVAELDYTEVEGEEYAYIIMRNHAEYRVCVTANSLGSIAREVITETMKH